MKQVDKLKALLIIITGFVVLGLIFNNKIFLYISAGVGVISFLIPIISDGIVWIWFKIAEGLGWINSRILLAAVFLVFLIPISWLYKITKRNPLSLRKVKEGSLYTLRNHHYEKEDFIYPW